MSNNVLFVEPNEINVNTDIVNGIPQYQDMYIFAELSAVRKGRTVLVTQGDGSYASEETGLEDTTRVNLLGINQTEKNPNYYNFTTNYYDGSTGEEIQYEGFGMTNIKVIINSSFIPQVNIQFVDVRGLAFFNRDNSPYRILFDFPPPLFRLAIKGYYGKSLTYELHLVKYTSEFKAENGNFVIDAQFVALTYAPLSDILFRYITNFPYMVDNTFTSPENATAPRNTFELIVKLRNLYSLIKQNQENNTDIIKYTTILNQMSDIKEVFQVLDRFKPELEEKGNPRVFIKETSFSNLPPSPETEEDDPVSFNYDISINNPPTVEVEEALITPLNKMDDYDSVVLNFRETNEPKYIKKRLYIVYSVGKNISPNILPPNNSKLEKSLNAYRDKIIELGRNALRGETIPDTIVSEPVPFSNNYDAEIGKIDSNTSTRYVGIDITELYFKLYKKGFQLEKEKEEISSIINTNINNKILETLGMNLTVYNVFKIIMGDVDKFFNILRDVSEKAEFEHHVKYKERIYNSPYYSDIATDEKKIYAFPLIVNKEKEVCGGNREERIAPIELSSNLPEPFPEIELVNKFISSFRQQEMTNELLSMRIVQNADGSNKWIPISPFDSILGTSDIKSPYYGIDGRSSEPVNINSDPRMEVIIKIILKRFYVLSQNTLPNTFYTDSKVSNEYIKLYSQSEAINLVASFNNSDYRNLLWEFAKKYNTEKKIDNFYTDFLGKNKSMKKFYDFSPEDTKMFKLSSSEDSKAYVDKKNPNYTGLKIYRNNINIISMDNRSDDIISEFQKNLQKSWLEFYKPRTNESFFQFTEENVPYMPDALLSNKGEIKTNKSKSFGGESLATRYMYTAPFLQDFNDRYLVKTTDGEENKVGVIENALEKGNSIFIDRQKENGYPSGSEFKQFGNVPEMWSRVLASENADEIVSAITGNSKLGAVLLFSCFGYALGPYNIYPHKLNEFIFQYTAAIEVPKYIPLYLGALVDADDTLIEELKEFFINGAGQYIYSNGYFIFADIADIRDSLSEKDKEEFKSYYEEFFSGTDNYDELITQFTYMYDRAKEIIEEKKINRSYNRKNVFENLLDPNENSGDIIINYYSTVIKPLIEKVNIINFSQDTFNKIPDVTKVGYTSIKTLNETDEKDVNDKYFTKLFDTIKNKIELKKTEDNKRKEEEKKMRGDKDIITQGYYSFKNINDKWLSNPSHANVNGYPYNADRPKLIDSFAFVDRAMNPIGDTIINAEVLIDLFEDHNATIFTVISQLLSINGFEFFPLQNFLKYENNEWKESFEIDTGEIKSQQPAFVCMYIGGTSSYPTGVKNGFTEDGIVDLQSTDAKDFTTNDCLDRDFNSDNQTRRNKNFPWREVRAFKVKFGEQNQSMFSDFKIDSKEYPETNESIQLLSRIAGDNSISAPVPKGQNLYNVFENRAYRATITGFGNAMIQPTQYFQLENVPVFNGAYVILSVEHNIVPNKMTTTFSGTKILRYPVPRITDPAALFGFEGGSSKVTNLSSLSAGDITKRFGGAKDINNDKAKYNSMYTFNIG